MYLLLKFQSSLFNSPSKGRYWMHRHIDIENEVYHNTYPETFRPHAAPLWGPMGRISKRQGGLRKFAVIQILPL